MILLNHQISLVEENPLDVPGVSTVSVFLGGLVLFLCNIFGSFSLFLGFSCAEPPLMDLDCCSNMVVHTESLLLASTSSVKIQFMNQQSVR